MCSTRLFLYNIEVLFCSLFSNCVRIFARNVRKEHNLYLYNCVYSNIGFTVVSIKVVVFRNLTTTLMGEFVYTTNLGSINYNCTFGWTNSKIGADKKKMMLYIYILFL